VIINGLVDPPSLEALACNEATLLALDLGAKKCVIASDCMEVIMNMQKQSLCAYSTILKEINARRTLFNKVVLSMRVESITMRHRFLLKVFVQWHQGEIFGSLGDQTLSMYLKTLCCLNK
jgi:hypothetical protein